MPVGGFLSQILLQLQQGQCVSKVHQNCFLHKTLSMVKVLLL